MGQESIDRRNREIIGKLFSASDQEVLGVIREIRSSGNPGLIPALIKLYESTASRAVSLAVVALVRDLKSQQAADPLASGVEKIADPAKKRELVAACWQSGLDFSGHLDIFLRIFAGSDYMTALEAFTVIENSLPYLQDATLLKDHIAWLKERVSGASGEEKTLYQSLLSLMEENIPLLPDQS